jgi:hypothetical protein
MNAELRKKYKLTHKTINKDKNTLLDAVALQDHYSKSIKLNPVPRFNQKVKLPPITGYVRP